VFLTLGHRVSSSLVRRAGDGLGAPRSTISDTVLSGPPIQRSAPQATTRVAEAHHDGGFGSPTDDFESLSGCSL
jgi:hypothetical protein